MPPLPETRPGDRFTERRTGLDHLAIGVPVGEVARLAKVLGDNIQWEFFEQP